MSHFNSLILRRKGLAQRQTSFSVKNDYQTQQQVGSGGNTYTRASKAYVPDFEGRIVQVQDNSPSFPGLRAVSNLLTYSEDFSNAAWQFLSPSGSATASVITFTGAGGDFRYQQGSTSLAVGTKIRFTVQLKKGTKDTIVLSLLDAVTATRVVTLPTEWTTYSVYATVDNPTNLRFGFDNRAGVGGDGVAGTVQARNAQYEILTGATNQNCSEYVPTTTATVTKWFDYANPFTVDGNGVVTDSGVRAQAYTSQGLLSEPAGTNIFANPLAPATQGITVAAVQYTLSFYGTGSIVATGTASFTLNGTGATNRVTQTFTPTAGTLTLTLSGSVTSPQLETGAVATSPMLSSAATSTRAATVDSYPVSGNLPANDTTLVMQWTPQKTAVQYLFGSGSGANYLIGLFQSNTFYLLKRIGGVDYQATAAVTVSAGTKYTIAYRIKSSGADAVSIFVNGAKGSVVDTNTANLSVGTNLYIGTADQAYDTGSVSHAYIGAVRIYNTALSDAECIRMTA